MIGVDALIISGFVFYFMEKPVRKAISKKTRFEVFKRDNFTCQYCSAKPPKVPLEIDHLLPVCKRGTNHIDNLITACFDCNRGKSGNELTSIPQTVVEKSEGKRIALQQYKEYQKILADEKLQIEKDIDYVEEVFSLIFDGSIFNDRFRISIKKFIKELGVEVVRESMETACNSRRIYKSEPALSYFCGICWNKIRES